MTNFGLNNAVLNQGMLRVEVFVVDAANDGRVFNGDFVFTQERIEVGVGCFFSSFGSKDGYGSAFLDEIMQSLQLFVQKVCLWIANDDNIAGIKCVGGDTTLVGLDFGDRS